MIPKEEIKKIYDQGLDAVCELVWKLEKRIEALEEKVSRLEAIIAKNSNNSSKPPSSDGFKKKTKSLRKKNGKRQGGQQGHTGNTLQKVAVPDHIIVHKVEKCEHCGCDLTETDIHSLSKRQVFDLPPMKIEVTEHQAQRKICPHCNKSNLASFPNNVTEEVQYGKKIKSLMVYFSIYQMIPYKRLKEIFLDLFKHNLSQGTLVYTNNFCHEQLEEVEGYTKQGIVNLKVANFDETGVYCEKLRKWLFVACNDYLTFYSIHKKRGSEAMNDIAILPFFKGTAVHDFWKPYFGYSCSHALCNAHILRELLFIFEQYNQEWANKLSNLLIEIKESVDIAKNNGSSQLELSVLSNFEQDYINIVNEGLLLNPLAERNTEKKNKKGKVKQSDARNLLDRLNDYRKQILAFMYDFDIPFDNNQAERDIRMVKLKQKISGCFRSDFGAKCFCRIRGYISTMKKQNHNLLDILENVFQGNVIFPSLNTS